MEINMFLVFFLTILFALLPLIEIRGAIPLGMSISLWGSAALSSTTSLIASLIGGVILCFISVAFFKFLRKPLYRFKFFRKIFDFSENSVEKWLNNRKNKKATKKSKKKTQQSDNSLQEIKFSTQKAHNKNKKSNLIKMGLVFVFCAIPGPFSGVWTSAALCEIINLPYLNSVLVLLIANLLSCLVVYVFCSIFNEFIDLILIIVLLITSFVLVYYLISFFTKKQKIKENL